MAAAPAAASDTAAPAAPPRPAPPACTSLPRERRGACRREQAKSLQRRWLAALAWDRTGTAAMVHTSTAAQVQLWLGVFAVNWRQLPDPQLLERQISTIRQGLGGSYGQLLKAMVLDPALQISLNGPANHRRQPNENLARELLELFALGEGNYSEADVREAARALTGYRLSGDGQLLLDPRRHDPGPKTILGRTEAFTGESLAGWLAEQPATVRYISGRIWRQLVGTAPKQQRLQELAAGWGQRQLSIPWLLAAIQATPEARESRQRGLRLADPLEVVARSLRLLGSRHPDALAIGVRAAAAMGQAPFEPPSVKGWPVNEQWLNLRWLQARRQGLQQLLTDEEVWGSAALPAELSAELTPIPPLGLRLPATASRENLAALLADPVWQLA
ncbi:MAG: DUF1800 family protein [Cyanobacteriota bacterium]